MSEENTNQPDVLEDGVIKFEIRGEVVALDLLCVIIESNRIEKGHDDLKRPGPENKGKLFATPKFLMELSAAFIPLGVKDCTPTIAHSIWVVASKEWDDAQKKTNSTPSLATGSNSIPADSATAESLD